MDDLEVTLTKRGQLSIPSKLRKRAKLVAGATLRWEMISEREFRIVIADKPAVLGPYAAIGWIRRMNTGETRSTDEIMADMRAGDVG